MSSLPRRYSPQELKSLQYPDDNVVPPPIYYSIAEPIRRLIESKSNHALPWVPQTIAGKIFSLRVNLGLAHGQEQRLLRQYFRAQHQMETTVDDTILSELGKIILITVGHNAAFRNRLMLQCEQDPALGEVFDGMSRAHIKDEEKKRQARSETSGYTDLEERLFVKEIENEELRQMLREAKEAIKKLKMESACNPKDGQ